MIRRVVLPLLLVAGLWQIAAAGWIHAKAWLAETLIVDAWNRTRQAGDRAPPWPWADTWPVARMEVPRLGVQQHILAGGHGRALAFAPGWIEGTALPGSQGSSVISGHRDTHFRFLKSLRRNDRILIHRPAGTTVQYVVEELQVVHERAGWFLLPDVRAQLLLLTCYPFDALTPGGPWRYLVTARHAGPA